MHRKLGLGRTLGLASAGLAVLAVATGLLYPTLGRTQSQAGTTAPPQAPAAALPSFEVASIKPAAPVAGMMTRMMTSPGGRLTAEGYTVKLFIQQAYDVKDFQISGGPGWINSERYNIIAKAEASAKPEQIKLMLQSLLAERFKLVIHRDTKELPVYALVVAKNGSKLHQSEPETEPGKGGGGWSTGRGRITGRSLPVATLAKLLAQELERTVVDKTGLSGNFDFKLEWTPDAPAAGLGPDSPPVSTDSGPSLFTALQEQLGLKLESAKGPVQVLVIDRVERPSEN